MPDPNLTDKLAIGVITIYNGDRIEVSWFWKGIPYYLGGPPGTKEEILNEAVPHESVHKTGKGREPFTSNQHDLAGWAPYAQVIDACMVPGTKRVF